MLRWLRRFLPQRKKEGVRVAHLKRQQMLAFRTMLRNMAHVMSKPVAAPPVCTRHFYGRKGGKQPPVLQCYRCGIAKRLLGKAPFDSDMTLYLADGSIITRGPEGVVVQMPSVAEMHGLLARIQAEAFTRHIEQETERLEAVLEQDKIKYPHQDA